MNRFCNESDSIIFYFLIIKNYQYFFRRQIYLKKEKTRFDLKVKPITHV